MLLSSYWVPCHRKRDVSSLWFGTFLLDKSLRPLGNTPDWNSCHQDTSSALCSQLAPEFPLLPFRATCSASGPPPVELLYFVTVSSQPLPGSPTASLCPPGHVLWPFSSPPSQSRLLCLFLMPSRTSYDHFSFPLCTQEILLKPHCLTANGLASGALVFESLSGGSSWGAQLLIYPWPKTGPQRRSSSLKMEQARQPNQPNQRWQSMRWKMLQPDRPHIRHTWFWNSLIWYSFSYYTNKWSLISLL